METNMTLQERDRQIVWHPYTQHKTAMPPLEVVSASGSWLTLSDGRRLFDAISSWWVNLHGHGHPVIAERIGTQARLLEHVIFAGFTHHPAVELLERLLHFLPGFSKGFYSDNGSTAVETALKMAVQFFSNEGKDKRRFIALKDSYHGDTFGAMSVSERGPFTKAFEKMLFPVSFVDPFSSSPEDELEKLLENSPDCAAFIFEPLVQGASGMKMYPATVLDAMILLCKKKGILTIADEVMTGFGRTGKMFAIDHLQNKPDIICLSKGLTGGVMPMALTITTEKIHERFKSDDKSKTLFHGHSFSGNPLGCAAALASLDLLTSSHCMNSIAWIEKHHFAFKERIGKINGEIRILGTIMAMELDTREKSGYFNEIRDTMYDFFLNRNVLLRPLGNVIYMLPPYSSEPADLAHAYSAIEEFLEKYRYGIS